MFCKFLITFYTVYKTVSLNITYSSLIILMYVPCILYSLIPRPTTHNIYITYLLTPCSRVLLEKLTGSAASQKIPRIFGTRKFLTVFTRARHMSLSWANSIESPQPPPTSWRSILILSSHLRLGLLNCLFPSSFPNQNPVHTSRPPSLLFNLYRRSAPGIKRPGRDGD